jgi:lysyl-tRNA synthetase class 2
MARARAALAHCLRGALEARGYLEVETPCLVPFAGQEPHLDLFESVFHPAPPVPPGGVQGARRLFLHTSPEYAMKRLLSRPGFGRCYQLARVFRDGEVSPAHNPEFTLLELYAAPGGAGQIQADLEQLVSEAALALCGELRAPSRGGTPIDLRAPFERLSCQQAFLRHAGFDPLPLDAAGMRRAAREAGVRVPDGAGWDDAFTQVLLEKVEPHLGQSRPTYLTGYPASQAALARLDATDPRVAERFELYAGGLELANGFGELNDAAEQRRRLLAEREQRRAAGRAVFGLDERFLAALPAMPEAGGVAVGFDRLLMLLTGARDIAEVLLFPAVDEYAAAERAP